MGSEATPPLKVFVSNVVPGAPGARGLGGAPPSAHPGVLAIRESQNTKTH